MFLLALIEINIYNAFNYFVWTKEQAPESNLAVRKLFVLSFINNDYIMPEDAFTTHSRDNKRNMEHIIVTAPPRAISLYVIGNGGKRQRQNTNNLSVKQLVAKNKSGPIVVVVLGNGCRKIATTKT